MLTGSGELLDLELKCKKDWGIDDGRLAAWKLDPENQIYDPEMGKYVQIITDTSVNPIEVYGEVSHKVNKSILDSLAEEITDEEIGWIEARQKANNAAGWVGASLLLVTIAIILVVVVNLVSSGSFHLPF